MMPETKHSLNLPVRLRRGRRREGIRSLLRETELSVNDFVYPVFVTEGSGKEEPVPSMPGISRKTADLWLKEIPELLRLGLKAIAPFPVVPEEKKNKKATEALNPEGLIPQFVREVKKRFPEMLVMTDIALDPFNSDGHDGIVSDTGEILNDETVDILCRMALCHAEAGADFVCPSDMMDGRIGQIRRALDEAAYTGTGIIAYSAKYASAFYGPFRDALQSAPKAGDKKTYQIDPASRREALREVELDIREGADIVMVKPAGAYLDIIREVSDAFDVPVCAYQVSGEYAMIAAAAGNGWLARGPAILESLLCIKRAGARFIWTYFAKEAALLLKN
ncbi:MAG: porphobilinogen synthase [Fibrobacter sp.]|jgi:porphobilinogen synthase|nr:porphobilinogen synthase [Fibrobacter sp.]